jgi:hypothetical protein
MRQKVASLVRQKRKEKEKSVNDLSFHDFLI